MLNKWSKNFDKRPHRRGGFSQQAKFNVTPARLEPCQQLPPLWDAFFTRIKFNMTSVRQAAAIMGRIFHSGEHLMWHRPGANLPSVLNEAFCSKENSRDHAFESAQQSPQNCSIPWGSGPPSNTWFLGLTSQLPNWHLDEFSHFCRIHKRDQQTGQTDRPCYSVCSTRPLSLTISAMQPRTIHYLHRGKRTRRLCRNKICLFAIFNLICIKSKMSVCDPSM